MSYVSDAASIINAYVAGMTSVEPTVQIEHENVKPLDTSSLSEWVRLTIRESSEHQKTLGRIGEREYEGTGLIMLQVFTKQGVGAGRARALADKSRTILRGRTFGDVKTLGASVDRGLTDGAWYVVYLSVPYRSRQLG